MNLVSRLFGMPVVAAMNFEIPLFIWLQILPMPGSHFFEGEALNQTLEEGTSFTQTYKWYALNLVVVRAFHSW